MSISFYNKTARAEFPTVRSCSRECQKQDWKSGHKAECKGAKDWSMRNKEQYIMSDEQRTGLKSICEHNSASITAFDRRPHQAMIGLTQSSDMAVRTPAQVRQALDMVQDKCVPAIHAYDRSNGGVNPLQVCLLLKRASLADATKTVCR